MRNLLLFILIILISSCTKEDYFADKNEKPQLNIVDGTRLLKEIDTIYKLGEDAINITLRIEDDSKTFQYSLNTYDSKINFELQQDSILSLTPLEIGVYKCEIIVEDSYGKRDQVVINFTVVDNYAPVAVLVFTKLENNNYRVNASMSYDPDGFITNYHFDYGIKTIDFEEPIVNIWADHLEDNGGVTLTVTDDKGAKSNPVFFELQ